jgi:hypothetical protein
MKARGRELCAFTGSPTSVRRGITANFCISMIRTRSLRAASSKKMELATREINAPSNTLEEILWLQELPLQVIEILLGKMSNVPTMNAVFAN